MLSDYHNVFITGLSSKCLMER